MSGKCYTYIAGNVRSRAAAEAKAAKQGRAVNLSKARAAGHEVPKK